MSTDPMKIAADLARRKAAGPAALTYLSLGAGVQSSTLALLAERGALPKPDLAIFADTQWEPRAVYDYLGWLESVLSFPVVRVTAGNLRQHVMDGVKVADRPDGTPRDAYRGIPVYTRGAHVSDGEGGKRWDPEHLGMARRQCTREFKIAPIELEVRRHLGIAKGQRMPRDLWVAQWTGISADEAQRAKPAEQGWLSREYPLLDLGWTRMRCHAWLREHGYPEPPKSACIGCPFHGRAGWEAIRENPEEWADAVEVDRAIRGSIGGLHAHSCFLHYSGRPLEEAIGQTATQAGQLGMFPAECGGVCGV